MPPAFRELAKRAAAEGGFADFADAPGVNPDAPELAHRRDGGEALAKALHAAESSGVATIEWR